MENNLIRLLKNVAEKQKDDGVIGCSQKNVSYTQDHHISSFVRSVEKNSNVVYRLECFVLIANPFV